MTTIERVAEAIDKALSVPHYDTYGSYDYSKYPSKGNPYVVRAPGQREIVFQSDDKSEADAEWKRLERARLASAALDAVCEGLVWGSDERTLTFNGRYIGHVYCSGNADGQWWGVSFDGAWPKYKNPEDAKESLMNKARKWIKGEA